MVVSKWADWSKINFLGVRLLGALAKVGGLAGERLFLPSRTSRLSFGQFHRTCRSSDLGRMSNILLCFENIQQLLTSGGRFAGVDVADNDDIDMSLFLTVGDNPISVTLPDMKEHSFGNGCKFRGRVEMTYPILKVGDMNYQS